MYYYGRFSYQNLCSVFRRKFKYKIQIYKYKQLADIFNKKYSGRIETFTLKNSLAN